MALVDGGVFANNPGMCGFVDRTAVQGQPDDALMISLGTGRLTKRIPFWRARQWGLLGWGRHIINVVFDGVTESVEYELEQVLSDFHRLQVWLEPAQEPMDKPGNVESLVELGEDLVTKEDRQIDTIVAKLLACRSRSSAGAGGAGQSAAAAGGSGRAATSPGGAGRASTPSPAPSES